MHALLECLSVVSSVLSQYIPRVIFTFALVLQSIVNNIIKVFSDSIANAQIKCANDINDNTVQGCLSINYYLIIAMNICGLQYETTYLYLILIKLFPALLS